MIKKILLLLMMSAVASAHAYEFSGTLVNGKGKPQKNVEVTIKGSTALILSDKNGEFMIPLTSPTDTVVVIEAPTKHAYIVPNGIAQAKIVLGKKSYDVVAGDSTLTCDYVKIKAPKRKSNVLTKEDIRRKTPFDLYELLRGAFPGVTVSYTSTGQRVSLRGVNSIMLANEPLFIIDGIEYNTSVDANNALVIESIEMVELNPTGAGYGIKGANGVFIITTTGSTYQTPLRGSDGTE